MPLVLLLLFLAGVLGRAFGRLVTNDSWRHAAAVRAYLWVGWTIVSLGVVGQQRRAE